MHVVIDGYIFRLAKVLDYDVRRRAVLDIKEYLSRARFELLFA